MTAPRNLLPGVTYLITRRCTQGESLLRPEARTNAIFLYWLALAAKHSGVEVHGFVQMPDRWHAVVTDTHARLPELLHIAHRGIAVDMNTHLGRRENFWASGHTEVIPLESADLVLEKLAELITSPVAEGLVKSPSDWPGCLTLGLGERHVAYPPDADADDAKDEPSLRRIRLDCTTPPALRDLTPDEAVRRLRRAVSALTARARQLVREAGRSFLGADGVRTMPRRGPPPERAEREPWVTRLCKAARDALSKRTLVFLDAYDLALKQWRELDRNVLFPEGTYLMRVLHRAFCGGAGSSTS